ncbi:MAG: hypothetical protein EPN92_08910 [Chitinophagaceae bacterium]|nr:MAG: hypothetical protein EPN92_08910 [Chitinophagaceae bacterium]
MNSPQHIQYLHGNDIDRKKWDECVGHAANGLIYAHSFYLDCMAKSWDALVLNDYEAVMPLPHRKKWGIDYLFQPFLTPILGVFGNNISEEFVSDFLNSIPAKYKLWDISLNHFNKISEKFQRQYKRSNYVLSLGESYDKIRNNYSENITRNISKADKAGCVLKKDIDVHEIIDVCRKEWVKFTSIEEGTFENLEEKFAVFKPYTVTYGVYDRENKLLSSCAFLIDSRRAYYWLVGNDPSAKDVGASPMLIDGFIRDFAGKNMLLDFEGSDKRSVAEFYQRFGARPEPFITIYRNRLHFPLNLLKKTPAHYLSLTS